MEIFGRILDYHLYMAPALNTPVGKERDMRTAKLIIPLSAAMLLVGTAIAEDFDKGMDAYSSGDYETAIAIWQPLAEAGDARGQYGLGLLYGNGFGVSMDDAQALHWYGLAAEGGHADAATKLGVMHQNGWGVPMSDDEAEKWYLLAAERGNTEAQNALGNLYLSEYGDKHDMQKAYMWFSIAARLGNFTAQLKRDELAQTMPSDDVIAAAGRVDVWFEGKENMLAAQPE